MALTESVWTYGLRGMVGKKMVFRKTMSGTVVADSPGKSSKEANEVQILQRDRFRLASFYAKRAKEDAELNAIYTDLALKRGSMHLRRLMVSDYFSMPRILSWERVTEPEQSGEHFRVIVLNIIRVKKVQVCILTPDGSVLDSGNATVGPDGQTWSFSSSATNIFEPGNQFQVVATDYPGNQITESYELA